MSIIPNWNKFMNVEEFEKEFKMEFKGPGWYGDLTKGDSVLITPMPLDYFDYDKIWEDELPKGALLHVYVWNSPLNNTIINHIANAPIRTRI